MVWFWDLLIVFLLIFVTWFALTNQARFTEMGAHGHHEVEHATHEDVHTESHVVVMESHSSVSEIVSSHQTTSVTQLEEAPIPAVSISAAPQPAAEVLPAEVIQTPAESPVVVEVIPDDLVIIEGIGPKLSSVLFAAGVKTFAQLAELSPEQIKQILEQSDPRLARISDPTSWPTQAKLAAAGDMQALADLQGKLKGGRG